ncbi:MAG: hypothetical protein K6E30_07610 [Lachnospiraceae bacterium]|nr:hypothetical protein [Lachnospiraceae bacterium]
MENMKKDWELYQSKLGKWQEDYADRLIKEYMKILTGKGTAAERIAALKERVDGDFSGIGLTLVPNEEEMLFDLIDLVREDVIMMDDVGDFSEETLETVKHFI